MVMTDPIADMLTRVRNANSVYHSKVEIPASKIKKAIAEVLKEEGFIKDYTFTADSKQGMLTVFLKYGPAREKVITGIKRISSPVFALMRSTMNCRASSADSASPSSPHRRGS